MHWSFGKKVTKAEKVSQPGCVVSGNKFLRQKKGPWRKKAKTPALGEKRGGTGVFQREGESLCRAEPLSSCFSSVFERQEL